MIAKIEVFQRNIHENLRVNYSPTMRKINMFGKSNNEETLSDSPKKGNKYNSEVTIFSLEKNIKQRVVNTP